MARRGESSGPPMGLVVVALVVAAALLLWMAFAVADFRDPVAQDQAASSVDPSRPPTADEPAPSGWAPPELASLEPGIVGVAAAVPTDLAAGVLDMVVAAAPVVVTVDRAEEPGLAVARGLARDLHAPLLVLDRAVAEASSDDDPGDDASPSPSSAPSEDPEDQPTDEGSADEATGEESTEAPATEATDDAATEATAPPTPPAAAPSTSDLLDGLGAAHVVAVGAPPTTSATVHQVSVEAPTSASPSATAETSTEDPSSGSPAPDPSPVVTRPEAVDAMLADAAAVPPPDGLDDVVALVRPGDLPPDLEATLELAGVESVTFEGDDPRRDTELQSSLADVGTTLLAVADGQWPELPGTTVAPDWPSLVTSAVQAPELFGGGKVLFPDRTFIASYGNFRGPALGVLGEREPEESVDYTQGLVDDYEGLFGDSQVQPAFEIIVTVASGDAEADGSYSRKEDLDLVTEWVDVATEAGVYVVLDLQPGREDFLTQAKRLEDLLRRPNVGLALDPEWRLAPDEVHLEQIGSVTTAEVNEVSEWLAELVRDEVLPQKLLVIHNFRLDMLTGREDLRFPAELATMVHVDGQGPQTLKNDTYKILTDAGPDELWWGWKNFFDEDSPEIRSPEDTAAIEPVPHLVTYQ